MSAMVIIQLYKAGTAENCFHHSFFFLCLNVTVRRQRRRIYSRIYEENTFDLSVSDVSQEMQYLAVNFALQLFQISQCSSPLHLQVYSDFNPCI